MENVKEKQQVYRNLTVEQAQQLLESSKEKLCLVVGNVVVAGAIRHSGDVIPLALVDPEMLTQPISKAHPQILRVYPLDEGLQVLASSRIRWDAQRQPKQDEVFTVRDECLRLAPNFMRTSQ